MKDEAIVLDSSVIVALFFPEKYSDWVEELIGKHNHFLTMDIAYAEVANVAWKRIFFLKSDEEEVLDSLRDAIEFINQICEVESTKSIYTKGITTALNLGISIYDALFVSLALEKKALFATLDKKLISKLNNKNLKNIIIHPY